MSAIVRAMALAVVVFAGALTLAALPAATPPAPPPGPPPGAGPAPAAAPTYSSNEVVDARHRFLGTVSRGLAQIVERTGSQFGLPNGYILGQEGGGAFIGGLRFGEGTLY